jgi:uncharacterized protein YceH (UPF0502 family)
VSEQPINDPEACLSISFRAPIGQRIKRYAGFVDEAAAWDALVRWCEGVEAPLRARIAELEREVAALRAEAALGKEADRG